MDNNEITMNLYVKMDIHDKRNVSHKFKAWTKCRVKIEAIKCFPCFLRLSFMVIESGPVNERSSSGLQSEKQYVTVSINVPGVSVSLATSRTKQFSYGLFWNHNRRECFIYFGLDTEASCRLHMKWIKKSIKNLELYRQVFLEQRRSSRNIENGNSPTKHSNDNCISDKLIDTTKSFNSLGPLPKIPDPFDVNLSSWSRRVSRASAIYEEIFESSRIARRVSRSSIASGIYEEMKPTPILSEKNCNVISEECDVEQPPPVPPLPSIRKRINTYGYECGILGDIPRSSTIPESAMAKKKKYKAMIDNLFGGRSKRVNIGSERQPTNIEDFSNQPIPLPIYMKDIVGKCFRDNNIKNKEIKKDNRNSFSTSELSKINLQDDECVLDVLKNSSFDYNVEVELSMYNFEASDSIQNQNPTVMHSEYKESQFGSMDSLNISEQIPNNFNFSACNTSTINLVGASGAVFSKLSLNKQSILIDDKTGYCLMTPILKNTLENVPPSIECTSTGYSGISAFINLTEDTGQQRCKEEESVIYENMCGSSTSSMKNMTTAYKNLSAHLYENMLTMKQPNELETSNVLATSTPTESPHACNSISNLNSASPEEESYYQTPRKSLISIDEKIPSYYPNICNSVKMRQRTHSPTYLVRSSVENENNFERSCDSIHELKHLVGKKLHRMDNPYMSSPTKIIEQQPVDNIISQQKPSKFPIGKKTAAHKVAENVYAVRYINKIPAKSAHINNKKLTNTNGACKGSNTSVDRFQSELLQLTILQNIDFKFDETKSLVTKKTQSQKAITVMDKLHASPAITSHDQCYEGTDSATHLLQEYANFAEYDGNTVKTRSVKKVDAHPNDSPYSAGETLNSNTLTQHLQFYQETNAKQLPAFTATISQSSTSKLKTPTNVISELQQLQGIKKFASLPRFKRIDFSPLKMRINSVLQRHQSHVPGAHQDL